MQDVPSVASSPSFTIEGHEADDPLIVRDSLLLRFLFRIPMLLLDVIKRVLWCSSFLFSGEAPCLYFFCSHLASCGGVSFTRHSIFFCIFGFD